MSNDASQPTRFAVCIRQDGAEDLEPRKLYQTVPDAAAAGDGYLRVIDESGEDYLYPADYFILLDLPEGVEQALRLAS